MDALTNIIESISQSVASQVGGAISSVLSYISNGVTNDVIAPATSDINAVLSTISNSVSSLEKSASTGIENTVSAAASSIGGFISSAESGFQSVIGGVENGVQTLGNAISSVFSQVVTGIENGFTTITGAVGAALQTVGSDIATGISNFASGVASVFTPIFTDIAGFIQQLPADIETIASDIGDALGDIGKGIATVASTAEKEIAKYVPGGTLNFIKDIVLGDYVDLLAPFGPEITKILGEAVGVDLTGEFGIAMGRVTALATAEFSIGALEELMPSAAFIMGRLLNHIADAIAVGDFRALQQAGNLGSPNQVLSIGDAIKAAYRGTITKAVFYDQLAREGYDQQAADTLYSNALNLLGLNELVALYNRGVITDKATLYAKALAVNVDQSQVDYALSLYQQLIGAGETIQMWRRGVIPAGFTDSFDDMVRQGFTPERIAALKEISYIIPNIEQQKEFIIRSVDDDALAAKLGLDTGLDDDFYTKAAATGWTAEDAKKLYRTSWQLPPFFILHTLYASGKINDADFTQLMEMQGFPPYFVDSFKTSLAPALTSGDIKDMYKYEVIDAEHIVPMLEGIGIPAALAAQYSELWQASVKLASPQDQTQSQSAATALKGETKGLIVTAYKDGILTNAAAQTQLEALGDTQSAAALRLSIADYQTSQENIKQVYATDKDNYLAGNITIEQVLTDLANAGATVAQQNQYFNTLQYAGRSKPKMPTTAEFEKWYKASVISLPQLADGLSLLGYADTWIPFFLLEAGAAATDITALGYSVPATS